MTFATNYSVCRWTKRFASEEVSGVSSLKVTQIKTKLRSMFESHLDLTDISTTDHERESKILSRCLAALAVYLRAGCSEAEAAASVWDGTGDDGIDAAYFDTAESRILFVQSKWIVKGSGEPEAKEIGTFTKGVRDAVEQDEADFHPRLQRQLADIISRLGMPGTFVHLVVVSTGASRLAAPGQSVMDKLLKELNGNDLEPSRPLK